MHRLPTCDFLNSSPTSGLNSFDSPLQMRLIKYLGLKKYMMDNFIFKRKPSSNYHQLSRIFNTKKK